METERARAARRRAHADCAGSDTAGKLNWWSGPSGFDWPITGAARGRRRRSSVRLGAQVRAAHAPPNYGDRENILRACHRNWRQARTNNYRPIRSFSFPPSLVGLSGFSDSWEGVVWGWGGRKYLLNEMPLGYVVGNRGGLYPSHCHGGRVERENKWRERTTPTLCREEPEAVQRRQKVNRFYYIKMLHTNNAYTLVVILLRTYVFLLLLFEFQ